MDLATTLGLLGALGVIVGAILVGPSPMIFLNMPGLLIVIGGTFGATLIKFNLSDIFAGFSVGLKAFFYSNDKPMNLINEGIELAQVARKEGLLGLEGRETENEFLKKGIQLAVDGHQPELVARMLAKDINLTIERHDDGKSIFKAIGDVAPAMGMIGTLVGLVQMLANMDDPKKIGPAMSVAILTTLYGAVIASAFAHPIADKLALRSRQERNTKRLILEIITAIQEGMNPRLMEEMLKTYLPGSKREKVEGDQEEAA
ncbi:MAG: flagellar motor protein PomA [Gammaproteobacteria bacterium]|nr:flagellar motor protein PomA [Gammaproteobacteria bacterium]